MKNDLTTGTWRDDIWCLIIIILLCTSDDRHDSTMQMFSRNSVLGRIDYRRVVYRSGSGAKGNGQLECMLLWKVMELFLCDHLPIAENTYIQWKLTPGAIACPWQSVVSLTLYYNYLGYCLAMANCKTYWFLLISDFEKLYPCANQI